MISITVVIFWTVIKSKIENAIKTRSRSFRAMSLFSLFYFFFARFYMTIMAATYVKGSKLTDNLFPRVLSYPPHGAREGRVGENPGNEVD